MQVSRVATIGLLSVLVTGCGRAPTASSPVAEPATVVAVPAALVMTAGDTAQVVVQANDRSGQAIGGSVFTFRLASPDLASVTERGLVTANGRTGATELLVSSGARQARVPGKECCPCHRCRTKHRCTAMQSQWSPARARATRRRP